jgi:hypothetical protein
VPTPSDRPLLTLCLVAALLAGGCGEPSERELNNARAFEALLTAVSLQNPRELEADARRIDDRHASGDLSEASYRELREVIDRGRLKDWAGAEKRAYEFRARFGDRGAYFR